MRNLKLKQVLPVDTETEKLQKHNGADSACSEGESAGSNELTTSRRLSSVKDTPGLHIMGDLYGVRCDPHFLVDPDALSQHCISLVEQAGLSAVGKYFHQFEGGGVTGMIVLAESHMSVHTWPEKNYVTVDVYVCSYSRDNRPRARNLYKSLLDTFQPERESSHAVERL